MKKSLFALAAVTAFAGAAQAQSSVTVYGILDVGYTGGQARVGAVRENVSRISNSMESGSRIGFRGTEDLGGGTSAIFTFEVGIQPAGNAGSNPSGVNRAAANAATGTYNGQGSAVWNPNVRQAFVGIQQKGMGNIRVGTQNTLFWEQGASNTTGQLSQTVGNMLTPSTDGAFFDNGTTATTTGQGASAAYTVRTTNTVRIATDRMAGLVGKAAYTMSNQTRNQTNNTGANVGYTGGQSDQNGYQLALDYVIQKANIQASYASFKSINPYTMTATEANNGGVLPTAVTGSPTAWGTGTQGTNVTDNQTLITASYDFGILKAFAGWTDRKVSSGINSNAFLKRSAQEIGVRSFITPKIEAWASGGTGRFSTFGVGQPTANIVGYQLGSNYWLSKRTNLYAIYGYTGTSSTSPTSLATSGTAANLNQYSIGARHTF
jgi:predicted porin